MHVGTPTAVAPEFGAVDSEHRTRDAVIRLLMLKATTATAIATSLGLTPAAVRRHLDQLTIEGAVTTRDARPVTGRGRGRPAKAYLLTEFGRSRLPHSYDEIAVQALEFLGEHGGPEAVTAFARQRAQAIVDAVRTELDAAPDLHSKVKVISGALSSAGFAADVERIGLGDQLCQHHCPVAHVAAKFPQLCEAEFDVIASELGTHTQRLATIARGDSSCTTFIPGASVSTDLPYPELSDGHGSTVRGSSDLLDRALDRPTAASASTQHGRNTS